MAHFENLDRKGVDDVESDLQAEFGPPPVAALGGALDHFAYPHLDRIGCFFLCSFESFTMMRMVLWADNFKMPSFTIGQERNKISKCLFLRTEIHLFDSFLKSRQKRHR